MTATRRRRPWLVAGTGRRGDRGTVTAELAVALPAVVLVALTVLVLTAVCLTQLRCAEAARAGARVAALGREAAEVAAVAQRVVGPEARVDVDAEQDWVEVTVSAQLAGGPLAATGIVVSASATAWREP